jgi:hypothetical protein
MHMNAQPLHRGHREVGGVGGGTSLCADRDAGRAGVFRHQGFEGVVDAVDGDFVELAGDQGNLVGGHVRNPLGMC